MCSKVSISVFVFSVIICGVLSFAQHPGAYSSPHYAKKTNQYSQPFDQPSPFNEPEYQKIATLEKDDSLEKSKHHEIDLTEFQSDQKHQSVDNRIEVTSESHSGRSSGFMASASSFLKGRGGQMLADIARELISRSTGATSQVGEDRISSPIGQVLSLNLTNLVILVVLKALILAAGMFGAGTWNHGYARSIEDQNSMWIGEKELSLWMGYLEGGDNTCLLRAACENPDLASKYGSGADILLTSAKMLQGTLPYDGKYEKILEKVREAYKWGSIGKSCDIKYKKCSKNQENLNI